MECCVPIVFKIIILTTYSFQQQEFCDMIHRVLQLLWSV